MCYSSKMAKMITEQSVSCWWSRNRSHAWKDNKGMQKGAQFPHLILVSSIAADGRLLFISLQARTRPRHAPSFVGSLFFSEGLFAANFLLRRKKDRRMWCRMTGKVFKQSGVMLPNKHSRAFHKQRWWCVHPPGLLKVLARLPLKFAQVKEVLKVHERGGEVVVFMNAVMTIG